jgi:hypothetical protein
MSRCVRFPACACCDTRSHRSDKQMAAPSSSKAAGKKTRELKKAKRMKDVGNLSEKRHVMDKAKVCSFPGSWSLAASITNF